MELLKKKKKPKTVYVKLEQDRVIRKVDNLKEAEVVMLVANKYNMLGKSVIDTKVLSEEEKLLEHRRIKHIIHSGEYTESMAYDVTKLALDMALAFIKDGIYSYDLLPHNFTFENGNWILYDFGALKITPEQVKTEIRSIFKISFSAFELTKIIPRAKLKHYYLNRIKLYDLMRMIPLKRWLNLRNTLRFVQVLSVTGFYERAYKILRDFYSHYEEEFNPLVYEYKTDKKEKELYKNLDIILNELGAKDIFCVGEQAGKWAIKSDKSLTKFVYFDDYDLCDKYYNYLKNNKVKNISSAVLYPFMEDENIPSGLRYRALYDYFAQERFLSDTVMISDYDEIASADGFDIDVFCKNIAEFAQKNIIIKLSQDNTFDLSKILSEYFDNVVVSEFDGYNLLCASGKIFREKEDIQRKKYRNENRMREANLHSFKIMQILKSVKRKYTFKFLPINFLKKK